MPTPEVISNFFEKFGVQLDDASIKTAVSNILINNSDPELREQLLKEYVKDSFQIFAIPYEQQCQSACIDQYGYSLPMDEVSMLDAYIGVVSHMALVVSGEQIESMKRAQEEAKRSALEAVQIANKASDDANKARENNEYGAKQKINDANELVAKAKLRLQRANDPDNFYFRSWEPEMPKFGLTSAEARKLYIDRVSSVKFAELRLEEMHEAGVDHFMFIKSVEDLDQDPNVTDYNSAGPKDQEKLRNIYVTRELMNTRLESKNWLWKLFHRTQTKAMRNYVRAADGLLAKLKFPEELKAPTMTAATTQGIRAGSPDVDAGLQEIDQAFAEVDQAVEARNREKLQKQEEKRKNKEQRQKEKEEQERIKKEAEEKAKKEKEEKQAISKAREQEAKKAIVGREAEINAEVEAIATAKKPIPDAFFDIRFRPSWDQAESKRQSDLCVEIGNKYITGKKNLPAGVKEVFKANYSKLRAVRNFVKNERNKLEPAELQKRIEELNTQFAVSEEMVKMEHASAGINYEPITFDQLKLQQDLANEFPNNAADAKSAAPVESKAPQKEFEQPKP